MSALPGKMEKLDSRKRRHRKILILFNANFLTRPTRSPIGSESRRGCGRGWPECEMPANRQISDNSRNFEKGRDRAIST